MKISLIAAMSHNKVIGIQNTLPWHMPADLKHFKQLTLYKPIIMGKNTFNSIGKALPSRQNIVLTRDNDFKADNTYVFHEIDTALAEVAQEDEVMIIGGESIYQQFLPKATTMYLTLIDVVRDGDAFFPEWNENEWKEVSNETHQADENNKYDYRFVTLKKIEA